MKKNDKKQSVLIIANGEPPSDKILTDLISQSDLIIAVDGGSNICYQKKINPDFILGDLDSIEEPALRHFKYCEIIKIDDQDRNDLDKALQFSHVFKPEIIRATAVFGKRLDHSLANLMVLQTRFKDQSLEFYDPYGCLTMIKGNYKLSLPVGTLVSLFSFLPVFGLSLTGFQYSLKEMDYPNGFSGLSNIIEQKNPVIRLEKGSLFLYVANDVVNA